ncbi:MULTISPECIES: GntR family transcriptional regulator [unclassified Roseitalea]|uniref:GntR family transcriptional regulator n=1 Tax=unclassified Roseitalea TaxID=2639107 RepID=UPI00273E3670|nr:MULTISPECIES: GntR family transcriptional regulator [unclassified Roseitalea]
MAQPRKSHRDRIYEDYLERIRNGAIARRDRLVDTTIAAELGVSRMPVRDALMRLAHEGYLTATTRGFTLPNLSHETVLEIFEVRRLLDPRAAAWAAQSLDPGQITALERHAADAQAAIDDGDYQALYRASEAFRNGWISAVPNREMQSAVRRYLSHVQTVRMVTMHDRRVQQIVADGQNELLDLFRARDVLGAEKRMLVFVIQAEQSYRALSRATDGR